MYLNQPETWFGDCTLPLRSPLDTYFIHCVNYFFHFSQLTDFQQAKGRGLCLIDFGRAIDIQVFPEGTMFSGSSETDGFLCPQMLEGRPWKWQVRPNSKFGHNASHLVIFGAYNYLAHSLSTL